jgi:hypothetical protein
LPALLAQRTVRIANTNIALDPATAASIRKGRYNKCPCPVFKINANAKHIYPCRYPRPSGLPTALFQLYLRYRSIISSTLK